MVFNCTAGCLLAIRLQSEIRCEQSNVYHASQSPDLTTSIDLISAPGLVSSATAAAPAHSNQITSDGQQAGM